MEELKPLGHTSPFYTPELIEVLKANLFLRPAKEQLDRPYALDLPDMYCSECGKPYEDSSA